FLDSKFGKDYDPNTDTTLLALLERFSLSLARDTKELIPYAIEAVNDEYFYGRTKDLEKIKELLNKQGIVVIHGEGGMGKTTLAAAFYHNAIKSNAYKDVAWLFCQQGIQEAVFDLAIGLGLD